MSEFYPDVVKIVAVKHVELKKLSYMYLTHYADVDDTCRELALLAISCFQRDLADSNQLIRALALRVLTSLRVRDIIAIQVIAVQKAATDGSAYVRKTCCHAIPKLFRMDQEQEEPLIEVIAKLLGDRSVMVISSAAAAFDAVCPDRWDIIHPVFRKICHLLSDLDEWGQQITLSVLVRYSRQNFCEPPERASNFDAGIDGGMGFASLEGDDGGVTERSGAIPKVMKTQSLKSFYGGPADGDETDSDSEEAAAKVDLFGGDSAAKVGETPAAPEAVVEEVEEEEERKEMDPDLKLFLRSMLPLLNSRNSGVIVAVATTYVYLGSGSPTVMAALGRALVRELRRPPGIRSIVLCAIRDVAKTRPSMFAGRLRRFFIKFKDSLECRKTKLEIISLLANRGNASTILKEFEAYLHESNVEFLSAVIRCVGRIAEKVPSVGARCLNGLLVLVHSPAAPVVASTVIVIRQLLQQAQSLQRERDAKAVSRGRASSAASALSEGDDSVMDVELAVRRLARMLEVVKVPAARASLVWILGEFQELIPKRAPDILRQLTQGFCDEDVEVKMQIMNAAVKLSLRQPKKKVIMLLRTYILDLARYDTEPDLRDRANTVLRMLASEQMGSAGVLFAVKECPAVAGLIQPTKFVIGSLSHTVAHAARGYKPLPPFTTTPSSASLREVEEDTKDHSTHFGSDSPRRGGSDGVDHGVAFDDKDYYSGDSESGDFYGSGSSDSGSGSGSDSDSSDSSSGSYYEDEESDDVGAAAAKSKKEAKKAKKRAVESSSGSGSDSETDSSSGSYYDDDESGDSDDEPAAKNTTAVPAASAAAPAAAAAQPAQIDLLMGLFDMGDAGGGGGGASSAPMMEPTMLEMTPAVAVLPLEPATPAVKDSAVPRFPVRLLLAYSPHLSDVTSFPILLTLTRRRRRNILYLSSFLAGALGGEGERLAD